MRRFRFGIFAPFFLIVGCGTQPSSSSLQSEQGDWHTYLASEASLCQGQPSKEGCDDGDMNLFNGLSCAAGDSRSCDAVQNSQGPDGRWWRSPRRVNGNLGQSNSYSRDMAMGTMLYLAARHDRDAAARWLTWIENNRPCLADKPWPLTGCSVRGPHRYCTDDSDQRCTLSPASWALMGRVWDNLGLVRNTEMRRYESTDGDTLVYSATHNDPGYTLHLVSVEIYLKKLMGASREQREKAAHILNQREPHNPFFRYLDEGATKTSLSDLQAMCPSPSRPHTGRKSQWAWERADSSEAWHDSMLWDCLFMLNALSAG